jgi:hypothetical protein
MGRMYPASGCSIGSAATFGYLAAGDLAGQMQQTTVGGVDGD